MLGHILALLTGLRPVLPSDCPVRENRKAAI